MYHERFLFSSSNSRLRINKYPSLSAGILLLIKVFVVARYCPVIDFASTVEVWPSLTVTLFTIPMPFTHHSVDFTVVGGIAGSLMPFGPPENLEVMVRVNSTLIAVYVPAGTVTDSSPIARLCSVVVDVIGPMLAEAPSVNSISIVSELFQTVPAETFDGMNVPLEARTVVLNPTPCAAASRFDDPFNSTDPLAQSASMSAVTPPAISVRVLAVVPDTLRVRIV